MKKIIGKVTVEEKDEIKDLFERKQGTFELIQVLSNESNINENYHNMLLKDFGKTSTAFRFWWSEKSKLYGWEDVVGYAWEIDFETCDVFLIKK